MTAKLEGGFYTILMCWIRIWRKTNAKIGQVLRYLRKTCLYKLFWEILLTKMKLFIKVQLLRIIILNGRNNKKYLFLRFLPLKIMILTYWTFIKFWNFVNEISLNTLYKQVFLKYLKTQLIFALVFLLILIPHKILD